MLDARRAIWWLRDQGYERIGILGTSLGSCLSMLTAAHEPLVRAQALNHISPHFADVVWRGLSTRHVREGLEGHVTLDDLRRLWAPISPWTFLDRIHAVRTLLVYAKYDLTFPVDLSRTLVSEFRRRGIPHELERAAVRPLQHRRAPFKYLDAYVLTKFLHANLCSAGAVQRADERAAGPSGRCPMRSALSVCGRRRGRRAAVVGRAAAQPGRLSTPSARLRDTSAAQPARCRGRLPVL